MRKRLEKKTLKELRQDPLYKNLKGRSQYKTKSTLINAMCDSVTAFNGDQDYGCFTGIKSLDALVMSYFDDRDIMNTSCTNKYFHSLVLYQPLWKRKTIQEFGEKEVRAYDATDFFCYYARLKKRILGDKNLLTYFHSNNMSLLQ